MSLSLRIVGILVAVAAMVAAFIVAAGRPADAAAGHHERSYLVTVENLTNVLYAEATNVAFFRPEPGRNLALSWLLTF